MIRITNYSKCSTNSNPYNKTLAFHRLFWSQNQTFFKAFHRNKRFKFRFSHQLPRKLFHSCKKLSHYSLGLRPRSFEIQEFNRRLSRTPSKWNRQTLPENNPDSGLKKSQKTNPPPPKKNPVPEMENQSNSRRTRRRWSPEN